MPLKPPEPRTSPKADRKKKASSKRSRLTALLKHDLAILSELTDQHQLIGLDEVGRGSLIAGVVGGAVCLPRDLKPGQKKLLKWLDDSKKLTPDLRRELSEAIHSFCLVGLGSTTKEEVDELNIYYASMLCFHRALQQLCEKAGLSVDCPELYLVVDGKGLIPDIKRERQQAIIKGDGLSAAIAAASIVAKHHRDTYIKTLALEFPGYGWEENMGYATPAHLKGIRDLGVTPLHRRNFKRVHEQLALHLEL